MATKQTYVNQLPLDVQLEVLDQVALHLYQAEGIPMPQTKEYLEVAKHSRLGDLEEVIELDDFIK